MESASQWLALALEHFSLLYFILAQKQRLAQQASCTVFLSITKKAFF
jgi:hypothetical protein